MLERMSLFLEITSILFVLWILHGSKKRPGINTAIYVCFELIIVSLIDEGWLSSYYVILVYIGIILLDILEFHDNVKISIVYVLADYFLVLCFQLIGAMIFALCLKTETVSSIGIIIINILMLLCLFCINKKYKIHKHFKAFLENGKMINGILIILGIVLVIMFKMQISKFSLKWDLVIFAIIFFFILLFVLIKLEKERIQKICYIEQLNQYQQYNMVYMNLISEIRHRQHDFNNHIQAIYSMSMACESIDELRKEQCEYIQKLERDNQAYSLLKENVSSILVAFLYIKLKRITDQGIDLKYSINVNRLEKIIPFPDIVELIGNLLDNAVEATIKQEIKNIRLILEENDQQFHLEICNCFDWDEKDKIYFGLDGKSKKGYGHGYGLTNVNKIVDKYNGLLQVKFDFENNYKIIVIDVILPLRQDETLS